MTTGMATIPTRERCAHCGRISAVGFHVPDQVWSAVVHPSLADAILCVACFADMADGKLVQWDDAIRFFPVSLRSHLGFCGVLATYLRGPS